MHEAAQKLQRMMEWRQDFLGGRTPSEADVAPEASTGKAYLHSQRDVNGRPVIIIRASRHVTGKPQSCSLTLDQCKYCVSLGNSTRNANLHPGHWDMICELVLSASRIMLMHVLASQQ